MLRTYYATQQINPRPVAYFDKLAFRTNRKPTRKQLDFLRDNSNFARADHGNPIRGSDKKYILTIVNPNNACLQFLSKRRELVVNRVEVALDLICETADEVVQLEDLFDEFFVQPWHGRRQTIKVGAGTYTGQDRGAGFHLTWYGDRASKRTGDEFCFHLEGRHQGVTAVRRAGIERPADLLTFDHGAYWRQHLNLFEIDLERLGRFHQNRIESRRRQTADVAIDRTGKHSYNLDHRRGSILFRINSADHPSDIAPVQEFVDRYGRGPYLRQLDVSALLPSPRTLLFVYV